MQILDHALLLIDQNPGTTGARILAHSVAAACSSSWGVSLLDVSAGLGEDFRLVVKRLARITAEPDFSNHDQGVALRRLIRSGLLDSAPFAGGARPTAVDLAEAGYPEQES